MKDNSAAFKAIAALLAGLGLLPFFWAGIVSGDWNVARVTLVDPIIVAGICFAIGIRAPAATRHVLSNLAATLRRVPTWLLIGSMACFILAMGWLTARIGYNGQPALTDELTQAFQGRILMAGRLTAMPERWREFFDSAQTISLPGRWFGEYPIGSAVLSALAEGTRLELLVYPALLVLAAIATWDFARHAYDDTTARVSLVLVAVSPFAFLLAGTRMNHVPALTLTAMAIAALARWSAAELPSRTRLLWGAALGSTIGAMVLVRPYDAVLVAIPIALFQLAAIARRRELLPSLAIQILVAGAITTIQLWVNSRTTGAAFAFGYETLNGPAHGPGFHRDPIGHLFTPAQGLEYVMLYLQQLNTALFESAVPALVFIVGGMWLTKPTRWDWLLAGLIVSFLAGYGAYWHRGELAGPRFIYPAIVAFVVFTGRFVILTARSTRPATIGAALMVPICIALAFLPTFGGRSTGIMLRLSRIHSLPVSRSEDPAAEAKATGLKNALVFVREPLHARLAARLRALGMRPFDAERAVSDYDACTLLTALAKSDARPERATADRLRSVIEEAHRAQPTKAVQGQSGFTALALLNGRPSSAECYHEMAGDSVGTLYYARFLAAAKFDTTGRLAGDVIYARTLGARDSILLQDARFATRQWYVYRRDDAPNTGRFERVR